MLGINGGELIIIGLVAVLVIGPARLPEYAEKLRNLIREVRRMASGAKETIKEESGVDLDSVDWRKLDPRQYDPRRIIREALLDDDVPSPASNGTSTAAALGAGSFASPGTSASPGASASPGTVLQQAPATVPAPRLAPGQTAPWDSEAT